MNSRFNSAASAASTPCHRLAHPESPNFPVSFWEFARSTQSVPATQRTKSSLFAVFARRAETPPLCFQSLANIFSRFFTLCERAKRHLHSFQPLPHSLQKYPGVGPPPRQNTRVSQPRLGQRRVPERSAPTQTRQANWIWSLLAMSLFRHIATSFVSTEKPYPALYHPMAKRYRTAEEVYTSSCREAKSCNPLLQNF
jgi:hypothetical protein